SISLLAISGAAPFRTSSPQEPTSRAVPPPPSSLLFVTSGLAPLETWSAIDPVAAVPPVGKPTIVQPSIVTELVTCAPTTSSVASTVPSGTPFSRMLVAPGSTGSAPKLGGRCHVAQSYPPRRLTG